MSVELGDPVDVAERVDKAFRRGEFDPLRFRVETQLLENFYTYSDPGKYSNFKRTPEGFIMFVDWVHRKAGDWAKDVRDCALFETVSTLDARAQQLAHGWLSEITKEHTSSWDRVVASKWAGLHERITHPAVDKAGLLSLHFAA